MTTILSRVEVVDVTMVNIRFIYRAAILLRIKDVKSCG